MPKLTDLKVGAGAALGLSLVVLIAGAAFAHHVRPKTLEASMPTAATEQQLHPTVSYWHVWTDENGVSHQNRCELSALSFRVSRRVPRHRGSINKAPRAPLCLWWSNLWDG